MNQKSTATAYLLWFFLGGLGIHKFYLGKTGIGVLYIFTFGLLGFGLLYDLFTLPSQVRHANLEARVIHSSPQNIINVHAAAPTQAPIPTASPRPGTPEQQILRITTPDSYVTLRDIIRETGLDLDTADAALEKLLDRGLLRKKLLEDGEVVYVEK